MQEWIGIVTNEIVALWLALACVATWLTILTAAFVWHIRKPNATHDGRAIEYRIDNSGD